MEEQCRRSTFSRFSLFLGGAVSLSVAISSTAAGSHSAGLGEEQEEPLLSVGWCEFDSTFLVSTDCGQGRTSSASGGERAGADEASCSVCSNLCLRSRVQVAHGFAFQIPVYLPQRVSLQSAFLFRCSAELE